MGAAVQLYTLSDALARVCSRLLHELVEVSMLSKSLGMLDEWTIGELGRLVVGDMHRACSTHTCMPGTPWLLMMGYSAEHPPDHVGVVLADTLHFLFPRAF